MFGSLVIVFPTAHEGGALVLRDAGKEWVIDAAHDIKQNPDPCVAFVAFYGDVEHEVLPITSGYRVTMTYNLYYERAPSINYVRTTIDQIYEPLKAALEWMLSDPVILPKGGYLGFGLRREYGLSSESDLRSVELNLKGSDALLMRICLELSMDVSLRMLYNADGTDDYDVLSEQVHDFPDALCDELVTDHLFNEHSDVIRVFTEETRHWAKEDEAGTTIKWVTTDLDFGYVSQLLVSYGNEPSMDEVYGHVCLIVTLGPHSDRSNIDVVVEKGRKPKYH